MRLHCSAPAQPHVPLQPAPAPRLQQPAPPRPDLQVVGCLKHGSWDLSRVVCQQLSLARQARTFPVVNHGRCGAAPVPPMPTGAACSEWGPLTEGLWSMRAGRRFGRGARAGGPCLPWAVARV